MCSDVDEEVEYFMGERPTMTVAEAMVKLGIKSRKTVIQYIERGFLKGRRLSPVPKSPYLVYVDSVNRFIEDREGASTR